MKAEMAYFQWGPSMAYLVLLRQFLKAYQSSAMLDRFAFLKSPFFMEIMVLMALEIQGFHFLDFLLARGMASIAAASKISRKPSHDPSMSAGSI